MTTPPPPPAGWYPDPSGVPGRQRYFDGKQWTEHHDYPPPQVRKPMPTWLVVVLTIAIAIAASATINLLLAH